MHRDCSQAVRRRPPCAAVRPKIYFNEVRVPSPLAPPLPTAVTAMPLQSPLPLSGPRREASAPSPSPSLQRAGSAEGVDCAQQRTEYSVRADGSPSCQPSGRATCTRRDAPLDSIVARRRRGTRGEDTALVAISRLPSSDVPRQVAGKVLVWPSHGRPGDEVEMKLRLHPPVRDKPTRSGCGCIPLPRRLVDVLAARG